jgi:DtxR family transcriptional regulator, Mn-dependent transcriptional regulator
VPKDSAALRESAVPTSPSEEMYLITVAVAEEEGRAGPLPLADLAESLGISPISANQMVRRLEERGLLAYHPYHGASLTPAGRQEARRVLRGRRLWGAFLVAHLGFDAEEADALACSLEHVTPPEAADRLARFLGDPEVGPLGRAIPPASPLAASAGRVRP